MTGRRDGMILLNVLIVVAVAAAAVTVMIVGQDIEVRRTIRFHEASQAQAYVRAGELSAVAALRRDAALSPEVDHMAEAWATLSQETIAIPHGTFGLAIADEQARFNLNSVTSGDPTALAAATAIADHAGVSRQSLAVILSIVAGLGGLSDAGPLLTAGIDPADLDRLAPHVTFLPSGAALNLNTADPTLMTLVLADEGVARDIETRRRLSPITSDQVAGLGRDWVGARSDNFRVDVSVSVGETHRRASSLIRRSEGATGPEARVVQRRIRVE